MTRLTPDERRRLDELLADEQLDQLSVEDRGELDDLRQRAGLAARHDGPVAAMAQRLAPPGAAVPADLRARLQRQGEAMVARTGGGPAGRVGMAARLGPVLLAASVALAGTAGFAIWKWSAERARATEAERRTLVEIERVRAENSTLLAQAGARADELARRVAANEARATEQERRLAEGAAREVELVRQLAKATQDLGAASLKIARYETPVDPATLAANRTKLLEVPGTIRVAWQPFDLPDAPAEQQAVQGDVVWNDQSKQGFLRFVGLAVNDPAKEQYQVWVIDERGMEQKVSGGVFNATAAGEVIVPIHPGIDVRRVSLFAITIEEPGGTWVPSLKRRVVVAPRGG